MLINLTARAILADDVTGRTQTYAVAVVGSGSYRRRDVAVVAVVVVTAHHVVATVVADGAAATHLFTCW